jgi:hypothetical protein
MSWLSPYRWLLIAGLIAALIAGYYAWADHIGDIREIQVRKEYTDAAAVKAEENRKIAAAWQKQKDEALNEANERAIKAKADADRLRTTNSGLRDELAASRGKLSGASCDSVRRYTETLNTVFGECAAEVGRMAEETQGISSDAKLILDSWPK